jgi:hypothetical protein
MLAQDAMLLSKWLLIRPFLAGFELIGNTEMVVQQSCMHGNPAIKPVAPNNSINRHYDNNGTIRNRHHLIAGPPVLLSSMQGQTK